MKNNQKLSLLFWLKKSKATADGRAPLYARVTTGGSKEEISVQVKVRQEYWDEENKRCTEPVAETKKINQKIQETGTALETHFKVLQTQFEVITAIMLKNVYEGKDPHYSPAPLVQFNNNRTLLEVFDEHIEIFEKKVEKGLRSEGTLRHWRSTKTDVQEFIRFKFGVDDIDVKEIRFACAEEFFEYLTLEQKQTVAETTAKGIVKKFKQMMKRASQKDYIPKNPVEGYKCSVVEPEVPPLEFHQVETIYSKKIDIPRLSEVRDCFIVQCFTGFSFQDLDALTTDHILKVGVSGEEWFSNPRGKTEVLEVVPVLPIVKEIMSKYENHPICLEKGKLFPIKSYQNYNGYLKEIAVLCGIPRELKTHLARHTFGDIMLSNGAPLEDVQKMLGHKSIRTTQRYARVRKERISENVKKVASIIFLPNGKLRKIA